MKVISAKWRGNNSCARLTGGKDVWMMVSVRLLESSKEVNWYFMLWMASLGCLNTFLFTWAQPTVELPLFAWPAEWLSAQLVTWGKLIVLMKWQKSWACSHALCWHVEGNDVAETCLEILAQTLMAGKVLVWVFLPEKDIKNWRNDCRTSVNHRYRVFFFFLLLTSASWVNVTV